MSFLSRRTFLKYSSAFIGASAVLASPDRTSRRADLQERPTKPDFWKGIRDQFRISREYIDMSALFIASHPKPVAAAIELHRRKLDENPVGYLKSMANNQRKLIQSAAAKYIGARADEITITDSTTTGIALVFHGISIRPDQEYLTTEHDYFGTHESIRLAAERTGAMVRRVQLFEDASSTTKDEILKNISNSIRSSTRVLAITWVHSSTGVKLPIEEIGQLVAKANKDRNEEERILYCIDGVHGFGVEPIKVKKASCDFFMAGCHKWLFGPRGTGILFGKKESWKYLQPTIPSFIDGDSIHAWKNGTEPKADTDAIRMTPGGFKAFEHQWALTEAFEFHRRIGTLRVSLRTHELNRQLKEGLATLKHIKLHTPLADNMSAGIVCFEIKGLTPAVAVYRLRERGIIATTTPYAPAYVRLSPSIRNTPREVEQVIQAVQNLV